MENIKQFFINQFLITEWGQIGKGLFALLIAIIIVYVLPIAIIRMPDDISFNLALFKAAFNRQGAERIFGMADTIDAQEEKIRTCQEKILRMSTTGEGLNFDSFNLPNTEKIIEQAEARKAKILTQAKKDAVTDLQLTLSNLARYDADNNSYWQTVLEQTSEIQKKYAERG